MSLVTGTEVTGIEKMPWGPLYPIDVPADKQPPAAGINSIEKDIQLARQKTTLEVIFLHKSM